MAKNLPYCSSTFAGDGFVLVGNASAFLDPAHGIPGMDWISSGKFGGEVDNAASSAAEDIAPMVTKHHADFARSYDRWFTALPDKCEYLGEYDLLRFLRNGRWLVLPWGGLAAFQAREDRAVRTGLRVVALDAVLLPDAALQPTLCRDGALASRARQSQPRNAGRRFMFRGYTFARSSALPVTALGVGRGWS